ncbi:hypothetical protein DRQ16_00075 [bacterium]|nr:MAG: hypothetical protein DRQ18_07840 [bacterium]RKZ24418.1 MAG: hypothetical protein DRQ16_00075 [bacterium]RKZ24812.1 MAG: hypothetical protein DRQ20_06330 [bacterium]
MYRRHLPSENLKPYNVKYIENPSQKEIREIALKHTPATFVTAYGNINKITRNKARMAKYTYIIAPESEKSKYSHNVIDPEKAQKLLDMQKEFIEKEGEIIEIHGYLGVEYGYAVPCQALYTKEAANVAGMQQILLFPREMVEPPEELKKPFKPLFRIVFTPGLIAEDMPGKQAMVVDLDNWTTHVIRADYFGESKKGLLRMLNEYVYQKGGLVFHAGAKIVEIEGKRVLLAVLGLSGTGKTTTTFSKQGEITQPLQDDMIVIWPNGKVTVTENGCFAKTFGLKKESEPVIYNGTIHPDAWVENVYMNEDGTFDFSKTLLTPEEVRKWRDVLIETGADPENVDAYISGRVKAEDVVNEYLVPQDGWDFVVWTQNGRSIIPLSIIENAGDPRDVPPLKFMGILNRDEGRDAITPGIVRFTSPEQAAGYFMLGETSKTSAAGKERGKTRSPFTQPFFPREHRLQAERFAELLKILPELTVWMMNTGYVGGDELDEKKGAAIKVKIPHSSAMLEAMLKGEVKWKRDPDFGYEIPDPDAPENASLLEKVPAEILEPRRFYEKQGRMNEYTEIVRKLKEERRKFLESHRVPPEIIKAVVG